jgi:hypothetical protein
MPLRSASGDKSFHYPIVSGVYTVYVRATRCTRGPRGHTPDAPDAPVRSTNRLWTIARQPVSCFTPRQMSS